MRKTSLLAFLAVCALAAGGVSPVSADPVTFTTTIAADTDDNGSAETPIQYAKVIVTEDSPGSTVYATGTTDANGDVSIQFDPGTLDSPFNLKVDVVPPAESETAPTVEYVPESMSVEVDANQTTVDVPTMEVTDCGDNLTVQAPRDIAAGESWLFICNSAEGDVRTETLDNLDGSLMNADSVSLAVATGQNYTCSIDTNGLGVGPGTAVAGGTANLTFSAADQEIQVSIVRSDGQALDEAGIDFQVTAVGVGEGNARVDFRGIGDAPAMSDGKFHVDVPNTPLNVSYQVANAGAAGDVLLLPVTADVTPTVGTPTDVTLTLPVSDATLTVTVNNPSGSPVEGAELTVVSHSVSDSDTFPVQELFGTTAADGTASFKLLSNRGTSVTVFTNSGINDPGGDGQFDFSAPARTLLTTAAGANPLTLNLVANDHRAQVAVQAPTGKTAERVSCSAANDEMQSSIIELVENNTFDLKASADDSFTVTCDGVTSDGFALHGSASYTASGASGNVTVTLEGDIAYDAPESDFVHTNVSSEASLGGSDTIEIPAGAAGEGALLAVSGGDALAVEEAPGVDAVHAVNIECTNVDSGQEVETFTVPDAEVVLHYTDEELNGVAETDISCAAQTKDGRHLEPYDDCTVDTDANTVTFHGVSHLSTYAINIGAVELSPTPTPTPDPTDTPEELGDDLSEAKDLFKGLSPNKKKPGRDALVTQLKDLRTQLLTLSNQLDLTAAQKKAVKSALKALKALLSNKLTKDKVAFKAAKKAANKAFTKAINLLNA